MTIDRKFVLTQLRDLVAFVLISLVQPFLTCPQCHDNPGAYRLIVIFTFVMWIMLWKGNELLSHYLLGWVSWINFPIRRFVAGIVCTMGYTILSVVCLMWIFEKGLNVDFGRGYTYTIYGSIVVTIVISLFLHGREFLFSWRAATIEKEKFQRESIAAKYESLKNQVNPHFLFNNLNALSNLVYEDQAKSGTVHQADGRCLPVCA